MRRYDDGQFMEREPSRRPIRDQMRDGFFENLGLSRVKDPFAADPEPMAQLALIQDLISRALSLHGGDKTALEVSKGLIMSSMLGLPLPGIGAGKIGRPDFQLTTINSMAASTFNRWFGSREYGQNNIDEA